MKRPKWRFYFNKTYSFKWIPQVRITKLRWKDKYGTPRTEYIPNFTFTWLQFEIWGGLGTDQYWEQKIWIEFYWKNDYNKAKGNWPWKNMATKESSWNENI